MNDISPLSDTEQQHFAERLASRATELHGEVRAVNDAERADREGFAGIPTDLVDLADMRHGGDMRHAERERDALELADIAAAQQRLTDGSYGDCIDCAEPIPRARLEAQPWAARCVPCQERHERTHGPAVPLVSTGEASGLLP